jgi:hemerythrin-like metal-binding protein
MSSAETALLPLRTTWDAAYDTGLSHLDAQHRALLQQCNRLADLCGGDEAIEAEFDRAVDRLKAMAREHFAAETSLLVDNAALDEHRDECEEFEYLAGEVATPGHFDRLELQRFLALWCVGHIAGWALRLREPSLGATPRD